MFPPDDTLLRALFKDDHTPWVTQPVDDETIEIRRGADGGSHGPTDGGTSGMAATVDVSGSSIRVRVTGLGATSVDWSVTGTVLSLEN